MATDPAVVLALRPLADVLQADGYELAVGPAAGTGIRLTVRATAAACADCLVPQEVFRGVVLDALAGAGLLLGLDDIDLVYPGDDPSGAP